MLTVISVKNEKDIKWFSFTLTRLSPNTDAAGGRVGAGTCVVLQPQAMLSSRHTALLTASQLFAKFPENSDDDVHVSNYNQLPANALLSLHFLTSHGSRPLLSQERCSRRCQTLSFKSDANVAFINGTVSFRQRTCFSI